MHVLFESADRFLAESDWKDLALIKFCLFAMGLLGGICLPRRAKKPAFFGALAVFFATYIPLMAKYFRVLIDMLSDRSAAETDWDF